MIWLLTPCFNLLSFLTLMYSMAMVEMIMFGSIISWVGSGGVLKADLRTTLNYNSVNC